MASYSDISRILLDNGYTLSGISDQGPEPEAVFLKPRPGSSSLWVTVPINVDPLPGEVIDQIMSTAHIDKYLYVHLLLGAP